jgi:hypothetical protein
MYQWRDRSVEIVSDETTMNLASGLSASIVAVIYYAVAYGVLILLKVRKERLFLYATLPLAVGGVIWVIWAVGQNLWGGLIVATMLLFSVGLAWMVKRIL